MGRGLLLHWQWDLLKSVCLNATSKALKRLGRQWHPQPKESISDGRDEWYPAASGDRTGRPEKQLSCLG